MEWTIELIGALKAQQLKKMAIEKKKKESERRYKISVGKKI